MRGLIDIMLEDVGQDAKAKGLHHIGWGRYADKSGKVVAKSIDGKLVNVTDKDIDQEDHDDGDNDGAFGDTDAPNWSISDKEEDDYKVGQASSVRKGSGSEKMWRRLQPGTVEKESGLNNYAARNPDGKLALFKNPSIATMFAQGKTLDGYDFKNDYAGSMRKLEKRLGPLLKKHETSKKKEQVVSFVKDILTAFVLGAVNAVGGGKSSGSSDKHKFGGGGGFSGGGSSGKF